MYYFNDTNSNLIILKGNNDWFLGVHLFDEILEFVVEVIYVFT
jgi:hypothetical protein